jgi:hypothetical protein
MPDLQLNIRFGIYSHITSTRQRKSSAAIVQTVKSASHFTHDWQSTVAETIDGKRLPAKPAYRLSVWKKGETAGNGFPTPISLQFPNRNNSREQTRFSSPAASN